MTTIDPRERLVQVGNKLLDALYEASQYDGLVEQARKINRQSPGAEKDSAAVSFVDGEGLEKILHVIEVDTRAIQLKREYITMRQTIEALTPTPAAQTWPWDGDAA